MFVLYETPAGYAIFKVIASFIEKNINLRLCIHVFFFFFKKSCGFISRIKLLNLNDDFARFRDIV